MRNRGTKEARREMSVGCDGKSTAEYEIDCTVPTGLSDSTNLGNLRAVIPIHHRSNVMFFSDR